MPLTFLLQFMRFHRELIAELEKKTDMDIKYMNVSIACFSPRHTSHMAFTCARTYHQCCGITFPLGHIQKIPVRTQIEARLLGQITGWPEETAQKKSRETFVQIWDQRKWGESLLYFWNEIYLSGSLFCLIIQQSCLVCSPNLWTRISIFEPWFFSRFLG